MTAQPMVKASPVYVYFTKQHTHTHTHTHKCTHTRHKHTHAHSTYIYTHTFTHTHTHKQTCNNILTRQLSVSQQNASFTFSPTINNNVPVTLAQPLRQNNTRDPSCSHNASCRHGTWPRLLPEELDPNLTAPCCFSCLAWGNLSDSVSESVSDSVSEDPVSLSVSLSVSDSVKVVEISFWGATCLFLGSVVGEGGGGGGGEDKTRMKHAEKSWQAGKRTRSISLH